MKLDIGELKGLANSLDIPLGDLAEELRRAFLAAYFQSKGALPPHFRSDEELPNEIYGEKVRVKLDLETGELAVLLTALDEDDKPIGEYDDTPADFDRVAATATRKVLGDRIQRAKLKATTENIENTLFTLASGVVQQGSDKRMVFVDLGKVEAQMPPAEQVPGEQYVHGQRIKVLLVAVRPGNAGQVQVIVSRTHPGLIKQLFALEVPEVADGTVEIKAIAREAGSRAKMAVISHNPAVAAKGACIGPKSARVSAVVNELNGEKIDIVDYSEDPAAFIAAALAPAVVKRVDIIDEEAKAARVFVADFQLSLAIGKEGQNARLAARLTGWRIDIRSDADPLYAAGNSPIEG